MTAGGGMTAETGLVWIDWHQGFTELFCLFCICLKFSMGKTLKNKTCFGSCCTSSHQTCSVALALWILRDSISTAYSSNRYLSEALVHTPQARKMVLAFRSLYPVLKTPVHAQSSCEPPSGNALGVGWVTRLQAVWDLDSFAHRDPASPSSLCFPMWRFSLEPGL